MAAPCGVLVFAGSFHAGRGILLHQLAERREGLLVEGLEEHVIGIPVVLQRAKKLSRVAKRTTTRRPITTWQGAPSHGVAERRARGLQRRAPPPPPLEDCIQVSLHNMQDTNNSLTCKNCYNSISKNLPKPQLIEFCKSPCLHPFERAGPAPIGNLKIGKSSTHSSHKLRIYKGLIPCRNCGNLTQGKLLKALSQPCEEAKAHGSRAKKRILEG